MGMILRKIWLLAALFLAGIVKGQDLREAKKYLQYQRYPSAINLLSKLHRQNPADLPVLYWLGIAYIENEDPDTAITLFTDAVPNTQAPLIAAAKAEALAAAGDPAGARQQFNVRLLQAARVNDPLTALAIGRALSRLNDFQQAGYFLQRAFALRPDPDILLLLAKNADQKRADSDATAFAQQALALQPRYAPALYFLACQSCRQKDTSQALAYLSKTIAADSLFTPAWELRYRIDWQRKTPGLSNDYLHYLALSDPDSAGTLALAPVCYNAQRYREVLSLAAQGSALNSAPELYRYAAYSHIQLHQYRQAFEALRAYASQVPALSETDRRLLALLAARFYNQYPAASTILEQAYDAETDPVYRAYYAQEIQSALKNQPAEALAWQIHRLQSETSSTAWVQTAMHYYRAGDDVAADSIAAALTRRFPDQAAGWYLRAYLASGKQQVTVTAESLPWLEKFVQTSGKDSTISKNQRIAACSLLVNWYQRHRQYREALPYLRTWSQLAPDNQNLLRQIRRWQ